MRFSESLDPFRIRAFSIAALAILLAILAEAMAGSYMALLAVERAHMGPLELSLFLTLSALSAIGTTAVFGRMHDEKPRLWPLIFCLVAGPIGYALCAVVTTPWMLMIIAFFLLGASNTAYALLFAMAKNHLDRSRRRHHLPRHGGAAHDLVAELGHRPGDRRGASRAMELSGCLCGRGGVWGGRAGRSIRRRPQIGASRAYRGRLSF